MTTRDEATQTKPGTKGKRHGEIAVIYAAAGGDKLVIRNVTVPGPKEHKDGETADFFKCLKKQIYGKSDFNFEWVQISFDTALLCGEYRIGVENRPLSALGLDLDGDVVIFRSNGDVFFDCTQADIDGLPETLRKDQQKREEFF